MRTVFLVGTADPLPLLYHVGNETVKYIITRDPKFDTMVFDPQNYRARVVKAGTIMDVTDISLERFRAKGGRIIITHGTADDLITPYNSIAYYKRQVAQFGQAWLDSFMRFYVIPGFGHGFGAFNAKFDSLGVLRDWVENGKAPTGLTAADGNPGPTAGRTRPLCEWPADVDISRINARTSAGTPGRPVRCRLFHSRTGESRGDARRAPSLAARHGEPSASRAMRARATPKGFDRPT
jgi:hypothetical protein